jgi:hypothetical protein
MPRPSTDATLAVLAALVAALVLLAIAGVALRARAARRHALERTRAVLSPVDGARYRVHLGAPDPRAAADALAALNGRATRLLRRLRARYVRGAAGASHPARRRAAQRLLARYNPDNLAENSPSAPGGDTAYSLDKGGVLAFCLRPRGGGRVYGLGLLTFVLLHELAHLAIDAYDHPPEFWAAFRFLLEEAAAAGIYAAPDFARAPQDYCGLRVDYSPLGDPSVLPL